MSEVVDIAVTGKMKRHTSDATDNAAARTKALDNLLAGILPSLPVDILPGETDPVGVALPQQPLHWALLPSASQYSNVAEDQQDGLGLRTNPCWLTINGTR